MALLYDISHFILKKTPMDETRREFFKKGLDLGTFAVTSPLIVKSIHDALNIIIEDVNIEISNLNKEYKIVQLSDVHIDGLINVTSIEKIVKIVNQLKPDIVVITGDLVDINLEYAKPALEKLNNLNTKYGTYFIVGNHEYIHGIDAIVRYMKTLNLKVLENESVYIGDLIDGFNLAGVYDMMGYRLKQKEPDIKKALENKKEYRPTVLLAHQPRFIDEVNGVDLVLSGHTHGGQIFPFNYLVRLQQPYLAGLYQHNKDTQIYVNKGTGFWGPPMRLGTNCEITNITLRNKV
jgi:predicted MPP superfamily phosphohydrolase